MTTPLSRRALSALVAVWFALAIAEQPLLHSCPVHDGPAPAGQAAHHEGHDEAAPEQSNHCCTCLGQCIAVGIVAPPATAGLVVSAPLVFHRAPLVSTGIVPQPTPHALPFQVGPPQSA